MNTTIKDVIMFLYVCMRDNRSHKQGSKPIIDVGDMLFNDWCDLVDICDPDYLDFKTDMYRS